jgi:glycosyltransferase involved in cell wall biosynthesis
MLEMQTRPRVSIITICYNIGEEIRSTAKSVANQTFKNFEWIVIDGESTDNTLEILNEYKSHIHHLISEKDDGVYEAMNKGLAIATGEYIICMNGGDAFASNDVLSRFDQHASKSPVDIIYGNQITELGIITDFKNIHLNRIHFYRSKMLAHQATFVKHELFKKFGNFDNTYKIAGDSDFFTRVFAKAPETTSSHLNVIVCVFNSYGMSSDPKNKPILEAEYKRMNSTYFTTSDEIAYFIPSLPWKIKGYILALLFATNLYAPAKAARNTLKRLIFGK